MFMFILVKRDFDKCIKIYVETDLSKSLKTSSIWTHEINLLTKKVFDSTTFRFTYLSKIFPSFLSSNEIFCGPESKQIIKKIKWHRINFWIFERMHAYAIHIPKYSIKVWLPLLPSFSSLFFLFSHVFLFSGWDTGNHENGYF